VFARDWTTCSKFVNFFRFKGRHNLGDVYDHSRRKIILASMMKKIFI
jgi:hypothetical protein